MKTVETMSLLGGHPVLDFVNTVDSRIGRIGPDYLRDYRDLVVFAERTALLDTQSAKVLLRLSKANPEEAEAALEQAKVLREALYRICRSESAGTAAEADDVALFDQATRRALGIRQLDASPNGLSWTQPPAADLDAVSDRVALAAMDLLVDATSLRRPIRECPGRNCGWLFLDTSRGGKRRWCSDKTCGTGARVRKYRAG